ncbi:hypothetical protein FEM48_Zijuj12G0188000 [Ziziphus jujuba var. spinosa]|uniref:Cullin family profile domain-containing protein n=1 Tax=Ziziphus jujuba var. spinosa TaxID=714518 RepID=A0A978UEY0_ZIZJJ|nr:hypothetical protein FEM48_Zijuj12G0188000 [Ziziphus jujuba var. spinosa]
MTFGVYIGIRGPFFTSFMSGCIALCIWCSIFVPQADKKDVVGQQEQVFVKVIELHDKYLAYVSDCFQIIHFFARFISLSVFTIEFFTANVSSKLDFPLRTLKEAFEVFCNKGVAGSSCEELLATFCDNILKKGRSEKVSDEAIEETLEKVVKLLAYVSTDPWYMTDWKNLAQHLLFDKRANDDHERDMLTKL